MAGRDVVAWTRSGSAGGGRFYIRYFRADLASPDVTVGLGWAPLSVLSRFAIVRPHECATCLDCPAFRALRHAGGNADRCDGTGSFVTRGPF